MAHSTAVTLAKLTAVGVIIISLCISIDGDGATRALLHFPTIDGLPAVHVGVDPLLVVRDEHSLEGTEEKNNEIMIISKSKCFTPSQPVRLYQGDYL